MIYSLTGKLLSRQADRAVISCGGVGFLVAMPTTAVAELGQEGDTVSVYTYLDVKEDSLDLYGFLTESQLACFKMLITVSGVGPKMALGVLALFTPDQVVSAIATGDYHAFCAVSGIGARIAQRLVLELKSKAAALATAAELPAAASGSAAAEAAAALVAMGFTRSEAAESLSGLPDTGDAGELIRAALQRYDERKG